MIEIVEIVLLLLLGASALSNLAVTRHRIAARSRQRHF